MQPMAAMDASQANIYDRPEDYDLEHAQDDEDLSFYNALLRRLAPSRVLEMACGSARVTEALARALPSARIVGIDSSDEMLARGRARLATHGAEDAGRVSLHRADMRSWTADETFDVVIIPCCSVSHLLTLPDRVATWRNARTLLKPGGAFVVDVQMPNLASLADSQRSPRRAVLQWDIDAFMRSERTRLVRCTATMYEPQHQRAHTRFFYDRFESTDSSERFVTNFESHVYFPSEVELLFLSTGFERLEQYGDYAGRRLDHTSPYLITVGFTPPT